MANQPVQEPETLEAEVVRLRALLSDSNAIIPAEWRLSVTEDKVFRVMLGVDCAARAVIAAGASLTDNRSIDVHITRIRKKLTPFGVEIETVRSRGWRLVGRFTWARVLAPRSAA